MLTWRRSEARGDEKQHVAAFSGTWRRAATRGGERQPVAARGDGTAPAREALRRREVNTRNAALQEGPGFSQALGVDHNTDQDSAKP